jgi:hypothetical protein
MPTEIYRLAFCGALKQLPVSLQRIMLIVRIKHTEIVLVWSDPHMAHDPCFFVLQCVLLVRSQALNCSWPTHFLVNYWHGVRCCVPCLLIAEIGAPTCDSLQLLNAVNEISQNWKQIFIPWVKGAPKGAGDAAELHSPQNRNLKNRFCRY